MKKRTFIKLSSAAVGGTVLSPLAGWEQKEKLRNWAGNLEYSTNSLYGAKSVEQVQQFVKKTNKLKVLGSRHCFNRIADSRDHFISLKDMDKVIAIDAKARTVTVEAGIKYGQLCPYLDEKGFALHNLASLPHISIAGACATATHGSGVKNGNLSTAVAAIQMVTAGGEIIEFSRAKDGSKFDAAVVNLGALGIVTAVTLNIVPKFSMRQDVYLNLPLREVKDHFEEIMSGGYSVSLFTDWQKEIFSEVWVKRRLDETMKIKPGSDYFGAKPATKNLHPIVELSAINCTEQMGVAGPWYERLPHFRMGFTPSSGKELQSEFFIPRQHAVEALLAVTALRDQITPHLFISEIRTIDGDTLLMSPCYKQPSIAIHFTWKPDWSSVLKVLPVIEQQLAPFQARPHWGKLFTMSPTKIKTLYNNLPAFQQLAKEYDPAGKFRNEFLDNTIYTAV
ncbi:MAG TPA: FAD-binding protein [Chitinophagaceae bacterium]|nr:FAD-binding protein [Chitinophagaceae bacterium]